MDNADPTISGLEGNGSVNGETDPNEETDQHEQNTPTVDNQDFGMKKTRGRKKGQKIIPREADKTRYSLRSVDGGRALRSTSNERSGSPDTQQDHNNESMAGTSSQVELASGGKKRGRKPKTLRPSGDKLSTIRNRVRSLVTRMNYEQNLIDAYSTDGWKGQNLEKLRPEKEIERAKAAIIKCKLKIRDSFQEIGLLAAQGKLDNSLFDDKGEIDCEDIFCAKCGMKNATLNNDIILCDGVCDRGFHQNCLNPPLLTKDIPPGDEGWLCPACDCKLDCIVLLNESKGSNLCLQDTWEKVFPEAAAAANGINQLDPSDLPSDDSEDDDYNPDATEGNNEEENIGEDNGEESEQEELSTNDSDFYTDSDDENVAKKVKNQSNQLDIEALPSEDSEDDDFDPEKRDSDEEHSEKMLNSDESDFTSDSDEFCDELVKKTDGDETVSASPLDQDLVVSDMPVSGRRQKEPTDYKKLYRETFGKASSDSESGDDEDWSEKSIKHEKGHDISESSTSKRSRSSKSNRNFGVDKTNALEEYFKTNQYPTRQSKEILAEELGLAYEQVNKWFESARRHERLASAEVSNGCRKRGRPPTKHAYEAVAGFSHVNTTKLAAPHTANSATKNTQNSPHRSVGTMTPSSSAVDVQKTPPASVGTSKAANTSKDFLDSERKKAIMRELRKQKMGR